jgi:hypothetical protein
MSVTSEELQRNRLEAGIRRHLKHNDTYHFRPIKIDGINAYIVLYGKYKILNVEAIYISCNVKVGGIIEKQQYSLYHYRYKTLHSALKKIERINKEFRIYNGELVSATCYNMLKLEECVLPYSEAESCCVCYESTSDSTLCGHSVCLSCRENCIIKQKIDCPVCREKGTLEIYTNRSGLVNNQQFELVKKAIHHEKMNAIDEEDDDEDFIPLPHFNIYNEEEEEEQGEEEEEEEEQEINNAANELVNMAESAVSPELQLPVNNPLINTETNEISEIINVTINNTIDSTIENYQIFWRISRTPSSTEDEINNNNSSMFLGFDNVEP